MDDAALEAASGTGFYVWYADEGLFIWSPGLLRLYGLDKAPMQERGFISRVHPDDRVRVEAETSAILGTDAQSFSHEFRIVRPNGEVRFVVDRGAVERDAEGRIVVLRGKNIDVTKFQQAKGRAAGANVGPPQGPHFGAGVARITSDHAGTAHDVAVLLGSDHRIGSSPRNLHIACIGPAN